MKRLICFVLTAAMLMGMVCIVSPVARAASNLTASEEMIEILMKLEGWAEKPYWDNSQYSVGYGTRPLTDADLNRYMKDGITKEESRTLLDHYLTQMGTELNAFADKHGLTFTQGQFDALLSLTFNCGTRWLYEQSTLVDTIVSRKGGSELLFAIGQWSTSAGKTSQGHVRRRLIECNMYLNNTYSMVVPENFRYVLYNNNGGVGTIKVQCYDANETVNLYSTPTMEGYRFEGWFTQEVGGTKVESLPVEGNPTIYAHWVNASTGEAYDPNQTRPEGGETGTRITVTATDVNLRSGPGTSYSIAGKANRGDTLTITQTAQGSGYTWGNTGKGWIALKYTDYTPSQPEQTQPPETTPAPTEPEQTQPPETTPAPTEPEQTQPPETTPAPTEPEQTQPSGTQITVTATDVNLRSGPGTNYELIGKADRGDRFTVTDTKQGGSYLWGKTEKGWIALKYTTYSQSSQPEQKPETQPEQPSTEKRNGTVTGSSLRIRKGPSTGYEILGYYNTGDRVVILEQRTTGSMIWGKTEKGWISMDYVKLDAQPNEQIPPETTPPATTPPATQPEQTTPPQQSTRKMGTITGNSLRIRSGAGISYAIRGYLNKGDRVEILDQKTVGNTTWGKINKGWISMDYVKLDTASSETTETRTGTVKNVSLRIRAAATSNSSIVGYLQPGEKVTILATYSDGSTTWGKISKGWIDLNYVTLDGVTEEKPEATVIRGTVTATSLYVRQTPGMTGKIVGRLMNGTRVEVLQTRKVGTMTWGQTSQGWISMDYVKVDN